jgi:hypothetical protein
MSGPFGSPQWMYSSGGFYPYELDNSLKFEDGDNSYLSRTPTSAGNRKTWTWSGWVKRGNSGAEQYLISQYTSSTNQLGIRFNADNTFEIVEYTGSYQIRLVTSQVFRDTGSWYHFVVSVDTTQATSSDRVSIYVNGSKVTSFSTSTYPSLNRDTNFNTTGAHYLGNRPTNIVFDGYLAEVNFIDGTALDASSFGEFKEGIWIPKDPTGLTYGTNGFRLPFTETTTAEGFNTVTYTGNGATQSIEGVGFEPDLIWAKNRSDTNSHWWVDSVRGVNKRLISNSTAAEDTPSNLHSSFDSDGFTVGSNTEGNKNANNYVAWCWDAGTGSAASNTDGSITSTVKANQDYGFSIVNFVSTGSAGTVGHGLGVTPKLIIAKQRPASSAWAVYNETIGATKRLQLQATDAATTDSSWNNTAPTSTVFSQSLTGTSGRNIIAYCFADVTGHQKIGTYTGTGSSGNAITGLGFKPAWIMIKKTDSIEDWCIYDNTRNPGASTDTRLEANDNAAEVSASSIEITFDSDGFTANGTNSSINTSGGTYIYLAIADTRNAAFWTDASGNGNDWEPNALQHSDVMPDTPTDGFATLNPLVGSRSYSVNFTEGNLEFSATSTSSGQWRTSATGMGVTGSGKYYTEINVIDGTSLVFSGVTQRDSAEGHQDTYIGNASGAGWGYYNSNGLLYNIGGTGSTSYGATYTTGDIIGIALDLDGGNLTFYKNNVSQGVAVSSLDTSKTYFIGASVRWNGVNAGSKVIMNFGQDSSFNANEIAQGNADDNGKGDFYYAPPSGYLALCNANLPDPAIDPNAGENPEDYFNTVTYTGTGSARSITGVGFQPDWVWIKDRSTNYAHQLTDSVRGATKTLFSNLTNVENTDAQKLTSFDTDGFSYGTNVGGNTSSNSYVAWNWLAGGTGVSNTDGSITSTVSANTEAGFSVVTYTGTGANATVGHGLDSAPDMYIVRNRNDVSNWITYHKDSKSSGFDAEDCFVSLNEPNGVTDSTVWNNTAPTSSVFSLGTSNQINGSSDDMIAYCFHGVEGFSKFGSYEGNGAADGTFVYTGFRPAWLMVKGIDASQNWHMVDNTRDTDNVVEKYLIANLSQAEATADIVDFLSNGFKLRNSAGSINTSGQTYIYMAFAEQPFKYSNAR